MSQSGVKIILFHRDRLVSILRDDIPHIRFPNYWDLPGGGIENGESPIEALLREIREELGFDFNPQTIIWEKAYEMSADATSYFFGAPLSKKEIDQIRFGDEGQKWELMRASCFCARDDAVPHFQARVAEFFHDLKLRSS